MSGERFVAVDTETEAGVPWSVQWSEEPGHAQMALATNTLALSRLGTMLADPATLTVVHNAPFDVPVLRQLGIRPARVVDTMVMGYLLGYSPLRLKILAYRHCGMEMASYGEVVRPATARKARAYLEAVQAREWPAPDPVLETLPDGTDRVKWPRNIRSKVVRLLKRADAGEQLDLREKWSVMDGHEAVEAALGPMPAGYLSDMPRDVAVRYACMDADATGRLYRAFAPAINAAGLNDVLALDMGIVDMVADMIDAGIRVDTDWLAVLERQYEAELHALLWEIRAMAGCYVNPGSPLQVAEALYRLRIFAQPGMSTDAKTLDPLAPRHPVVAAIQRYRQLAKLLGTYIRALPSRLDTEGRVHTSYRLTVTETGRLSSRDPNLQNIPARRPEGKAIRKAFIATPGCVLVALDYCVTGDTVVITTDGPMPISKLRVGIGVLSAESGANLSIQRVSKYALVGHMETVEVVLDNGESVRCTPDHKWMRYDGKMVRTADLHTGTRLAHVKDGMSGRYPTWYIRSHTNYLKKHVEVCQFAHGPRPDGFHADHINGNVDDWAAGNLRWMGAKENFAQGGQRYWGEVHRGERPDTARLEALREGLRNRRSYSGSANPNHGKLQGKETTCAACGKVFYQPPSRKAKYCSSGCYHVARVGNNHRVAAIIPAGVQPVYQITVDNTHTYVLANGLVSGNSQIELRIAAHVSQDPLLLSVYRTGGDIHEVTRAAMYGDCGDEALRDMQRKNAKVVNFGTIYLITPPGLVAAMHHADIHGITELEAAQWISWFFQLYRGYSDYVQSTMALARREGQVSDLFGRVKYVPEVYSTLAWVKEAGLRAAVNFPIQSGAGGVLKAAMRDLTPVYGCWLSCGRVVRPLLQVHDELVFEVEEGLVDEVVPQLRAVMEQAVTLDVPVTVDVEIGPNWKEGEEWAPPAPADEEEDTA